MDDEKNQESQLYDLQQTAEAIEKLSADPKAFAAAYEAFVAGDADKFGAALGQVGISDRCRWVCRFFCRKRCAGVCRKFCPNPSTVEVNADEILGFAKAVGPMLKRPCFCHSGCAKSFVPEMSTRGIRKLRRPSCSSIATNSASSFAPSVAKNTATKSVLQIR